MTSLSYNLFGMKGEQMKRIKRISKRNIPQRILLLLSLHASLYWAGQTEGKSAVHIVGKVDFGYLKAVDYTDSRFTNTADINGDTKLDILGFKGGNGGFISWYEYPSFRQHIVRKGNFNAGRPLAADVDSDGDMDIIVAKNSDRHVYWYENPLQQRNPTKNNWIEHRVGSTKGTTKGDYIKDYGVADFDCDGRRDIVVCTFDDPAEIFIYFQDGKESWQKKTHTYKNGHEGLDIGDIDGDGDPDVVTNGRWFETPDDARQEKLVEHNIDSKWHNQSGSWQRNATMIQVADLDGNGRLDIVISHSEMDDYPLSWYRADDPKGSWAEYKIDPSYGWCQTLDVGDVDMDGDMDILAGRFTRPNPPDVPPPHDVRIYYNPGEVRGNWDRQVVRSNSGIYFGHLADMDADGDLDIVGPRSYWTGPLEMWENQKVKSP